MRTIKRRTYTGFTLIELLVVVVIIGLLAAYVGPRYFAQLSNSEVKAAQSQIEALGRALDAYRLDIGHYPTTQQGLQELYTSSMPKWQGPYLNKKVPQDPWGRPYLYIYPNTKNGFTLYSQGPDGQMTDTTEKRIAYE